MKTEIRKIVYISLGALTFVSLLALILAKNVQKANEVGPAIIQQQRMMENMPKGQESGLTQEQTTNPDTINFSDPGDDEIGQTIKEMDDMINSVSPSEYDESNLSDDVIEGAVELQ